MRSSPAVSHPACPLHRQAGLEQFDLAGVVVADPEMAHLAAPLQQPGNNGEGQSSDECHPAGNAPFPPAVLDQGLLGVREAATLSPARDAVKVQPVGG